MQIWRGCLSVPAIRHLRCSGVGDGVCVGGHEGGGSIGCNEWGFIVSAGQQGPGCANPVGKLSDGGHLLEGDEGVLQQTQLVSLGIPPPCNVPVYKVGQGMNYRG